MKFKQAAKQNLFLLTFCFLILIDGGYPLVSIFGQNDTDYQWDRRNNIINPFQLFQNAFIWVLDNAWLAIIGFLGLGVLIVLVKKIMK